MQPYINPYALIHASMEYQRDYDKKKLAEEDEDFETIFAKAMHEDENDGDIKIVGMNFRPILTKTQEMKIIALRLNIRAPFIKKFGKKRCNCQCQNGICSWNNSLQK